MSNIYGFKNNDLVSTRKDNTTNSNMPVGFIKYIDNRPQIVLYDTSLSYNPNTDTLNVVNLNVSGTGTGIDITDTDNNNTYYITFIDDLGNTKTLNIDKTTTALTYNPNTGILNAENLNGQFLVIDATGNNSDYRLTCISNTPSTYNQMLYTDLTYNPQTNILKVGKLDNCFALTSSGGNLPILFIDHTATGKQFLYNNNNFYYNPTLGEFLLQGNLTTQNISGNQLTLTSTDAGSSAGPDLILYRNSASPSINDYIGQIQFKGRNTDPADTIYAKINCVLADASSAGGQSYIETTLLKTGSPILISRLFTTELQLLNGCGLNVDNYIEAKGHCVIEGKAAIGLAIGSSLIYKLDVYDTTSFHCKNAIRSSDQTLEISSYYQAGVGQYSYLQSRQEATPTNYSNLLLNPNGGNVGIGNIVANTLLTLGKYDGVNGTKDLLRFITKRHASDNNRGFVFRNNDTTANAKLEIVYDYTGGIDRVMTFVNGGNVGIGTDNPAQPLDVSGIINYTDRLIGGESNAANNNHIDCYDNGNSSLARGIFFNYYASTGSGYTGYFNANPSAARSGGLYVNGSSLFTGFISKSGGGFNIKHPVLGHDYRLVHSFVEAPEASNMYRGKAKLINGTIDVNIDKENNMTEGTFVALNTNFNIYVNNNDPDSWDMVKGRLNGNILTIYSNNPECNAVIDYLVIGERQDEFMKSDKNDATDCCGKIIVERPSTKTECNCGVDEANEGSNNWKDYYNKENCKCIDPYLCYDLH